MYDSNFRLMADAWYTQRNTGIIASDNFQLHPPRNLDNNIMRNNCGILQYPLLLDARVDANGQYYTHEHNPDVLMNGLCLPVP